MGPRRRAVASLVALVLTATVAGCAAGPPISDGPAIGDGDGPGPGGGSPSGTVTPITASPAPAPSWRPTPVKAAIFGDSQGSALYATRPRSVATDLRLSDRSISACGILRGRVTSRSGERFDLVASCPNWLAHWREDAKRTKPDIALVIIGAWDVFDLRTTDATLVFATPEWDANFLATLHAGLAAIRESGAQIALAELPCYRPRKSNPRPPGWWPERGDDDRTQHVNELLRRAADNVHTFTVRPASAFCTDPAVGDNKRNRYDGIHYLQPGASIYFDAIIPQLLTLPS